GNKVLKLLPSCCAGNRGSDCWLMQWPCECKLCSWCTRLGRNAVEGLQDAEAPLVEVFFHTSTTRTFTKAGLAAVLSAEEPAGQCIIGDDGQAFCFDGRQVFGFKFLPVVQVIKGLEANVTLQPVFCRKPVGLYNTVGRKVGSPEVADFPALDNRIKRFHCFRYRRFRVIVMALV